MKIFNILLLTCLLSSFGISEDNESPAEVINDVSAEAEALRALVEQYKARDAAKKLEDAANAPVPPPSTLTEITKKVESITGPELTKPIVEAPQPPAIDTQSISDMAQEIKNDLPSLNLGSQPTIEAPQLPAPPAVPAPPVVETPKVVIPALPSPPVVEAPTFTPAPPAPPVVVEAPVIPEPVIPEMPQTSMEMAIQEKIAAAKRAAEEASAELQAAKAKPAAEIASANDLISNPIESVDSVISEAASNQAAVEAIKKEIEAPVVAPSFGPIIIDDSPPSAPKIAEIPVIEKPDIMNSVESAPPTFAPRETEKVAINSGHPSAPEVKAAANEVSAKAEEMAASAIKEVENKATQEVAKADEIKSAVKPKPSVVAKKKATPPATKPAEVAVADTPATTPAEPEAVARRVTPVKNLGRLLFGPKGSIFKGKAKGRTATQ